MQPRPLATLLEEGSPFESQASVVLAGRSASAYTRMVRALLGVSRLSRAFPDRRAVQGLIRFLAPDGCHFIYDHLEVGLGTGLPIERMITRVQADRELAPTVCEEEETRDPELRGSELADSVPGDDLRSRRYRYHRALMAARVQPSFALHFELRRVDEAAGTASLTVVLDRFDLAEELFVRYTILLSHSDRRWTRSQVRLDGDDLETTASFRNLVARTATHDAELAFILMSDVASLEVESVQRCRIGPVYAAGFRGPPAVQAIVDEQPGEFILCLPSERAAVDINRDSNADPLAVGYRDFIGNEAGRLVEARRRELGYRVRRERKLVCTPKVEPALRRYLDEQGKKNVIYTIRGAA